jgi:hypothetical protein
MVVLKYYTKNVFFSLADYKKHRIFAPDFASRVLQCTPTELTVMPRW